MSTRASIYRCDHCEHLLKAHNELVDGLAYWMGEEAICSACVDCDQIVEGGLGALREMR